MTNELENGNLPPELLRKYIGSLIDQVVIAANTTLRTAADEDLEGLLAMFLQHKFDLADYAMIRSIMEDNDGDGE